MLQMGVNQLAASRQRLISTITANQGENGPWDEAGLRAFDVATLEKIAQSVTGNAVHTGGGQGLTPMQQVDALGAVHNYAGAAAPAGQQLAHNQDALPLPTWDDGSSGN